MDTLAEYSTVEKDKRPSNVNMRNSLFNEKKWEWGYLRRKCRNLELEQYYESYMQRLRLSYLSLFIIINFAATCTHLVLLFGTVSCIQAVYFDICIYIGSALCVWIVLSINFREDLVKRKSWIPYVSSWIAISFIVAADLSIPTYHGLTNQYVLTTAYASYTIYAIYIFFPLPHDLHAILLGLAVTTAYIVSDTYTTFRKVKASVDQIDVAKVVGESVYFFTINMFGIYFRLMKEIAIRTTFLDRRQCVEENLLLRYARDQEKSLLLSIIPSQIANKIEQDVKMRIEQLKLQNQARAPLQTDHSANPPLKRWRQPDTEKLFIEPHNDVSILYADVVNYTHLTTTLDVKTLVETLHDLFVKFDLASEEYNVLRIKFLGDCYYCVAGVPIPNEYHAKCCTDLGLRMIKDIRDVRTKRQLNIDMRIGVHSGNILSGVIGACKWQFDIWSKDVDIANRLEQTGMAGRVHVSEQTLKLLDGEYMYEEGTMEARNDEVLRKYRIRTFLIKTPRSNTVLNEPTRRVQAGVRRQIDSRHKSNPRTNFMQNTLVQYTQIRAQAKLEMNREMDKMPVGRIQITRLCFGRSSRPTQDEIEEQSFRSNITSCCLFFKDWRWEFAFMKEPDVMLKYSMLFGALTYLAIMTIQFINEPQSQAFWIVGGISITLISAFLFLVWFKKAWIMFWSEAELTLPQSNVSRLFYNLSDEIQGNVVIRVVMYLLLMAMYAACSLLQLLDCNRIEAENKEIDIQLFNDGERGNLCFNPWSVTYGIKLMVCMAFLFTRIPFILKFSVGFLTVALYSIIVLFEYDFIYEKSPGTNVGLYAEYSHLFILLMTLGIFHIMDRQTEFISKVDYNWNRQLQKKQDDAKFTNETIKILIHNILPSHVADIYMTKKMQNELYYEEYENVAVMFATIKNYDTEKVGLRVLNEIICDFDAVLGFYKGLLKIEKIKVAGWTYMAACGLDVERSEKVLAPSNSGSSMLFFNGRRSHHNDSNKSLYHSAADSDASISNQSSKLSVIVSDGHAGKSRRKVVHAARNAEWSNVVYVMARFALDLMKTMHAFNMENLQYDGVDKDRAKLRIGISNGEIMAGVVGSYKPHYDIWGNPVNMASRMDSTGIPGHIQVTEESAKILQSYNIRCTYRGLTFVKGRGNIPTYFLGIDKDFNFIKVSEDADNSSSIEGLPKSAITSGAQKK